MEKITHHPEFLTATILNWENLLQTVEYKYIILENLHFLVQSNKIILYAYCIMDNHIHLIWQIKGDIKISDVKRNFFTRTAQAFKTNLRKNHPEVLQHFVSSQSDRRFHFWERRSLGIDLFTDKVFEQKLEYIHNNPVKAGICVLEEEYSFSSARFYYDGYDPLNILTHYKG